MKKFLSLLLFGLMISFAPAWADEGGIQWSTNYQESLTKAQAESKPVLLFFTGSDWCGWCKRLEQEVFEKPDFAQEMGDKMVFVFLDYPMRFKLDPATAEQNKKLKEQYQVSGYPTVVLISPEGEQLGRTGYLPGGPRAYSSHLMNMTH